MNKYKLAIFDVDGTLLDTSEGIISSVKYTIDHFGLYGLSETELRSFIGPPIQNSFAGTYGISGPILQQIASVFRTRYKDTDLLKAKPYEGIYDTLTGLLERDIKIAIATYKREDYARTIVNSFGFNRYSRIIHGADDENKLTKSDIIDICIRESGVEKNKAIMIGDTENDAAGADYLKIDFLAVSYGFGFKPGETFDKHPHIGIADTPLKILKIIDDL